MSPYGTMPVMPAQKPQANRSPTPFALQVRLTKPQYAYLLLYADHYGSMGAALRHVLDQVIDDTQLVTGPEGEEQPAGGSLRSILAHADLDNFDPEELSRLLADPE